MKIDIVFSGREPHLEFVEVETPDGRSLGPDAYGGEWVADAPEGYLRLRIDTEEAREAHVRQVIREEIRVVEQRQIDALRRRF